MQRSRGGGDRRRVEESRMSDALTSDQIAAALEALPGWEQSGGGLERTVPAADEDAKTLQDAIAAVGHEVGREAAVEHTPEGVRVRVGGEQIVADDVELAAHLDRLFSGGVAWRNY
jgi:pterin-4a-carbinolamine dehydratase